MGSIINTFGTLLFPAICHILKVSLKAGIIIFVHMYTLRSREYRKHVVWSLCKIYYEWKEISLITEVKFPFSTMKVKRSKIPNIRKTLHP